jgi:AI-2E family transporter
MPVVLLDPSLGVTAKISAFVIPSVIHMIIGNLVEPLVFGSSMELHPITVLLALAIWYSLYGIPGAILAVPLTAVMRIVFSAIDHPYASIARNALEGRLSLATQELAEATSGESLQMVQVPSSASSGSSSGVSLAGGNPFAAPSFALGPSLASAADVEQGLQQAVNVPVVASSSGSTRAAIFVPGPSSAVSVEGNSEAELTRRPGGGGGRGGQPATSVTRQRGPSLTGGNGSSRSHSTSPPVGSPSGQFKPTSTAGAEIASVDLTGEGKGAASFHSLAERKRS